MDDAPQQRTTVSSPATKTYFANRPWLLALVLVVTTFVAYQSVWRAGFIWDDDDHLTANPAMTAPHGLRMIWSSLAVSRYYPLTLTTFWVQRRLWGLNPLPYHQVNIALHALNGILVFLVLRRLRVPAAWLAAMLWVLHPVNVESVAWITELKNTQSGFFFFLSLLCFLRFEADKKPRWYVLALVCGLAAMLSKPSTVVLPVVLLLCVWWQRGRWLRADIARIAPFFGVAVGMSALAVIEQRGNVLRAGTSEWQLGMAERLVIAGKGVWFYAGKVLWPVHQAFVYPRWELNAASLLSWVPLAGLGVIGLILWRYRNELRPRAALFGCGFFVAALMPVLGFSDIYYFRYSFVADHFQYLASVGLITLAASTGTAISRRLGRRGRNLGSLAAAVVLLMLGLFTWRQGRAYQGLETLWRDTLAKNPQCWMAHTNLGDALVRVGKVQEAIWHYEQALRFNTDFVAHYHLSIAYVLVGEPQKAIGHLEQALKLKPSLAEAQNNLAWVLATLTPVQGGDPVRAMNLAQRACELTGNRSASHLDTLAVAYAAAGRFDDAVTTARKAIELARAGTQPQLVTEMEERLELYRNGRAYHPSADATSARIP